MMLLIRTYLLQDQKLDAFGLGKVLKWFQAPHFNGIMPEFIPVVFMDIFS